MSQALPMSAGRRAEIYGQPRTPRQQRQWWRMLAQESDRAHGKPHGATGERIRRPLEFVSKPPERGSFRTHIAAYCAPCDIHWRRPRLHRYLGTRRVDNVHGRVTS